MTDDTTKPTAIVHRTPGLLDTRSLTVMGLSAKPRAGGHPIGQFGTGLKYAIATLVRLGAKVTIFIGTVEFVFVEKKHSFRGSEYTGLRMKKRAGLGAKWVGVDLPFTTEYGKYWKPWMAFRELESNTIDEGGVTVPLYADDVATEDFAGINTHEGAKFLREQDRPKLPYPDHTTIVVECPEYVDAWLERDSVFLPDAKRVQAAGDPPVQALPGESDHVYFRGLRVLTLPKRSTHTYNILQHVVLTEDRTLYGDFQLRELLGYTVRASSDEAFIEPVLVADESYWEHNLEHPKEGTVSVAFMNVVSRNQQAVTSSAFGLYAYNTPRASRAATPWERAARPWRAEDAAEGDQGRVVDAKGRVLFLQPLGEGAPTVHDWNQLAFNMVKTVNAHADRDLAAMMENAKQPVPGVDALEPGVSPKYDLSDDIPF